MPKSTETVITEIEEFEPSRVDGVGKGANGFPILLLKAIDAGTDTVDNMTTDALKADDRDACSTCDGTGKIMAGNRKCPKCLGSGKTPKVGESAKAFIEAVSKDVPGSAPSGSGPTPAITCPTCSGDGVLADNTPEGTRPCPDCNGTGDDSAMTDPERLAAVPGDPGRVSVGDPDGRERVDKGHDDDGFRPDAYKPDPDETVQCPKCDKMNDTDAAYCDQCGHELMGDDDVIVDGVSLDDATKADMSTADINDLDDSAFAHIEAGGKKDKSGKTTPRSLRHFKAHVVNALARASQSEFGDEAMPKIKAAAKKFGVGEAAKASVIVDGATISGDNPSLGTPTMPVPEGGAAPQPGDPEWEALDAATATAAAQALMQAAELIRQFAQRETQEVVAGEGNDIFDAGAAGAALCGVSDALGIMAQLAFHEGLEANKGLEDEDLAKAGKRLSSRSIAALAAARDHLSGLLGADDPAKQDDDDDDAVSKHTKGVDLALLTKEIEHMTTDEFEKVLDARDERLVGLIAEAFDKGMPLDNHNASVASAKDANSKSKKKDPKAENADLEDEADQGDNESASGVNQATGAAKGETDDDVAKGDDDEIIEPDDDDAAKSDAEVDLTPEEIEAKQAAKEAKKALKAAKRAEKEAADNAAMQKAIAEEVAKAEQVVHALQERLEQVEKMAAPSTIVRTRTNDEMTKSVERDTLEIRLAKAEKIARETPDTDLRTAAREEIAEIRTSIAALSA